MHVILVYDASDNRDRHALRICRKYLHWTQNSVFEGRLTPAQLRLLRSELATHLNRHQDSVIVYTLQESTELQRQVWGIDRGNTSPVI